MRLNLASGIYVIEGFHNLDPIIDGWTFQTGLGRYNDRSVEAITISHGLCYVPLADWPAVFAEFDRVLGPGGVIRVQDEWANHPESAYYPDGFPGVTTLTTPELVTEHMRAVGLDVATCAWDTTTFIDRTLIQHLHKGEPNSFAVEGTKP